jgi:hypothetical protein
VVDPTSFWWHRFSTCANNLLPWHRLESLCHQGKELFQAAAWGGKNPEDPPMLYTTQRGESFDLEKDFSSAERHILQKLFIWKDMAVSVEEFRLKKREALGKGWGDSGPIQASRNLDSITRDFEAQVALRLRGVKPGQG